MFFQMMALAVSMSIDSLGIGMSYGIRNIRIKRTALIIISGLSLIFSSISVFLGSTIKRVFPGNTADLIGIALLLCIGVWIVYQADTKKKKEDKCNEDVTVCSFFIKALGITINIIKSPESSDIDHSKTIDAKEAFYLGVVLSIDSVGAGIGGAAIGINPFLFPPIIAVTQLIFLTIGRVTGKKIKTERLSENFYALASGYILIIIAAIRLIGLVV